jgi:tRNA threonylcarbamoyladenosine biosynthesis protein TsaB
MSREPELKANAVLAPMLDARREDVYMALFDRNLKLLGQTVMCTLSDALFSDFPASEIWVAGSGSAKAQELLGRQTRLLDLDHSARLLIEPAFLKWKAKEFADAAYFRPDYITAPNITQPRKPL